MPQRPIYIDGFTHQLLDADPPETDEWIAALDDIISTDGETRARYDMARLTEHSRIRNIGVPGSVSTPYINTIPPGAEANFPGDADIERRIRRLIRWNAAAMVIRANKAEDGIGGHLSTFASSATLYEVGFNHFFRGSADGTPGDHIYFQGHATPGIYARAFLEGRLTEDQLDHFRREIHGGLSSYPHPPPDARFLGVPDRLHGVGTHQLDLPRPVPPLSRQSRPRRHQELSRPGHSLETVRRMSPKHSARSLLPVAKKLDNLTWVVNCNLQRLDGPVRGNGKIIQELEANFRGGGGGTSSRSSGAPTGIRFSPVTQRVPLSRR